MGTGKAAKENYFAPIIQEEKGKSNGNGNKRLRGRELSRAALRPEARRPEYEVKTSVRLNMSNPQHVKINDVIQNLDPKIFKSKNQFIIDAIQFYIDNYGKETFVIKKKEKERAEYIRSEDIDDIKEEVIDCLLYTSRCV